MTKNLLFKISTITALSLILHSVASAAMFSDIASSRNRTAIEFLQQRNIIGGYSDGTFRPTGSINRAELAKILVGGQGIQPSNLQYRNCFLDVGTEWFAPYICYAKDRGWIAGYSDETFRPGNSVNTAEAIKMIVNTQGFSAAESLEYETYSDVSEFDWYAGYVAAANAYGLLERTDGRLGVGDSATRGQVAESIYRAIVVQEQQLPRFAAQGAPVPQPISSVSSQAALNDRKRYNDGTYRAIGRYYAPSGQEEITISLTLRSDIIVNSTYEVGTTRGRSGMYQEMFGQEYQFHVVGKNIHTLDLQVISGASLTTEGFMNAVEDIKAQAAA